MSLCSEYRPTGSSRPRLNVKVRVVVWLNEIVAVSGRSLSFWTPPPRCFQMGIGTLNHSAGASEYEPPPTRVREESRRVGDLPFRSANEKLRLSRPTVLRRIGLRSPIFCSVTLKLRSVPELCSFS